MRPDFWFSLFVAFVAGGSFQTVAASPAPTPVMVGGESDLDACASTGIVVGLKPVPGNFLAVREGPGPGFAQVGELPLGDRVWLCDSREDWMGIVYGEDCGVSTPKATRTLYTGPCASGWVSKRYIELEAG
jgi:hypothetical protein